MPGARPLTVPVVLIVAIVVLPLLQSPPVVRSPKPVVAPAQTESVRVMVNGKGLMVTAVWAVHPVAEAV